MIEADVIAALDESEAVQDLIEGRIYALVRPQDDPLPALAYQRISTVPVTSLDGDSGLDNVRLRFSCYAKTLLEAKTLAAATRAAINEASGLKSTCVMEMDDQDQETRNFRVIVDFNIWQRG
jgi:hypothetical protein